MDGQQDHHRTKKRQRNGLTEQEDGEHIEGSSKQQLTNKVGSSLDMSSMETQESVFFHPVSRSSAQVVTNVVSCPTHLLQACMRDCFLPAAALRANGRRGNSTAGTRSVAVEVFSVVSDGVCRWMKIENMRTLQNAAKLIVFAEKEPGNWEFGIRTAIKRNRSSCCPLEFSNLAARG